MLDPNKPHEFVVGSDGIRCQVCSRSNSPYGRPYHTPPFQQVPLAEAAAAAVPIEIPDPDYVRALTDREREAARGAWPDYNGFKRHPYATSTGMEGGCEHCGGPHDSPLHDRPWEPPRLPSAAPVIGPPPVFANHSFEARQDRIRGLWQKPKEPSFEEWLRTQIFNAPAVSNPSGGEPENTKESNMNANINLSLKVKGYESIIPIIRALNAIDGVEVADIEEVEKPPVYRSSAKIAIGTLDKRRLLREATDERRQVVLDYTTEDGRRDGSRTVVPVSFEDDLLLATDPAKAHGLRSFKLDRMARVTRP